MLNIDKVLHKIIIIGRNSDSNVFIKSFKDWLVVASFKNLNKQPAKTMNYKQLPWKPGKMCWIGNNFK